MKVGVCVTKSAPQNALYKSWIRGIRPFDEVKLLTYAGEVREFGADVLIQFSRAGKGSIPHINFRRFLDKYSKNHTNVRRIFFERGFVGKGYLAVGFDGLKGKANYYNDNSNSDRWKKLNIELKPWRTNGKHILVLGSNAGGPSIDFKYHKWEKGTAKFLLNNTARPIIWRKHQRNSDNPGMKILGKAKKKSFSVSRHGKIDKDLNNCWCCIAATTNAAIRAIILGIPVMCSHPGSMVYGVAEHDLDNLENPQQPNREQWAYNLAYCQWHLTEIDDGTMWKRLREFV